MSPEVEAAIIKVAGIWAIELEKNADLHKEQIENELITTFKQLLEGLHKLYNPPTSYSQVKDLRQE